MGQNPFQNGSQSRKERRKLERFDLRLQARIEALLRHKDKSPVILNLVTGDISAQGAFFTTEDSLEKGTRVKVDLMHAPERQKTSAIKQALIHVTGTLLRTAPAGMAVVFDKGYRFSPLTYV
jgi:hypothetical protein